MAFARNKLSAVPHMFSFIMSAESALYILMGGRSSFHLRNSKIRFMVAGIRPIVRSTIAEFRTTERRAV
jgi:hypothetical protein